MQKIQFKCDNCEAHGTVRLPDDCDENKVQCCPCCGEFLPDIDEDDE
jgi:hypothetical protein